MGFFIFVIFEYMGHKNEYLVRLSESWYEDGSINIESGKYEGAGMYRMIHAESFEEAIEKWNDRYCPEEFKREWGDCGMNESLVMVIDRKGRAKFYM
jgi:hypothetical protein